MTRVLVHEHGTTVILPCGLVVEGRPHDTDDYRTTARELGYGDDVLALCRDHDALHAALAAWLGLESFALREAAGLEVDPEIAAAEEAAVLATQKFMRLAGATVPLKERSHERQIRRRVADDHLGDRRAAGTARAGDWLHRLGR